MPARFFALRRSVMSLDERPSSEREETRCEKFKANVLHWLVILKRASLFEITTGIYHRNRVTFVPKSVGIISMMVVLLIFFKTALAFNTFDKVINIVDKDVEELDMSRYAVVEPENIKDAPGDFPLSINIHNMTCD